MPDRHAEFRKGFEAGYANGVLLGRQSFATEFDGVSIIIPTFNKKELLMECLDSIETYTDHPYEVIVVDNGSQDGTEGLLRKRRGPLRIAVHGENLGFARAVNTGLMMAKGSHIVLLNNDVIVTNRWLSQMLRCLQESPGRTAVGPVTNYISGEQQIEVPYTDISGMQSFASAHNRTDSLKWRSTDRLVGFCLLFAKRTFEEIGFFDEGYEIGNYEDDDWMIRLRLQGINMKIAGDTFVHHYGSMTMKDLGAQGFANVNEKNESFFTKKWGNPLEALRQLENLRLSGTALHHAAEFAPTHCWIRSCTGKVYWLEHGIKYPLAGHMVTEPLRLQATRLSVIDLLQFPVGTEMNREEDLLPLKSRESDEGKVLIEGDGRLFQIDRGHKREILSSYTCQAWGLAFPDQDAHAQVQRQMPWGLPIIPPVQLLSEDL